jgi:septal ring factor EnvC (AmiA/AmiB activator)
MFSKIKKYVIGFFVLLGGVLIAFFSGKDAGRSKERRKDVDKKLKIVKKALKSNKKYKKDVQQLLNNKKKELEELKEKTKNMPKKKSAKKAHRRLKKIGRGKK